MLRQIFTYLVILFFSFMSAAPAEAVVVNVNGQLYDITAFGANRSFDDDALLTENVVPWWGDVGLANDFANAFLPFSIGTGLTHFFAYSFPNASDVDVISVFNGAPAGSSAQDRGVPNAFITYMNAVAVPEINGPVLAKALFVLFVFGAWLMVLRRRLPQP